MINAIKTFLRSKKGLACTAGVIAAILAGHNIVIPEDSLQEVLAPILAYICGQGLADLGKEGKTDD